MASKNPTMDTSDLQFIRQIMDIVEKEQREHDIQPRLRVVSANDYIVQTITSSGGRNPMPDQRNHDLLTQEGRNSLTHCAEYGLISKLFFLVDTTPQQRHSAYKSQDPDQFHRDDLEPWLSLVGVIRKWDGHI